MNNNNKNIYTGNISGGTPNACSAHILHDSKSLSYLKSYLEQPKKFRQTTCHPVTTKNSNLQFLRYTVTLNKNPTEKVEPEISSSPIKIYRKMTEDISICPEKELTQIKRSSWRPEGKGFRSPIKHRGIISKIQNMSNLMNSIEDPKKTKPIINCSDISSTDWEARNAKFKTISQKQKYLFTPKINKLGSQKKQGSLINSYSSADLLKGDHANSPTSDSISSRKPKVQQKKLAWLNSFEKIKFLGEGKFGQVHLVKHQQTNSIYALKQIKKDSIINNKMQEQLLMEIKMQAFFDHPNILKLYGFFDDEEHVYLILEYMEEGTLYSQLKKQKTFKQGEASKKLRDVLEGVKYMHEMMVAHRDIKPQNIVISNDVCKLCDLGWAAICEDRRTTLCGTIDYASPELLEGKQYGISVDLWCLGVLCYELMVGKAPFYHISRKQTMKKIINADLSDITIPNQIPNETRDFIGKLLKKNGDERMSANEALKHPLILKYLDEQLEEFRLASKRRKS